MQDLLNELNLHRGNLNLAIKELKTRGQAKAEAEKNYRVALAKEMLRLRTEGTPVTIISDLCRGNEHIATLKMHRDIAETLWESAMQAIYAFKLNIDIIQNQINATYKGV